MKNAITETWSNGQAEGQINRLKTLKRAMYGRAGVELLRAEGSSADVVAPAAGFALVAQGRRHHPPADRSLEPRTGNCVPGSLA